MIGADLAAALPELQAQAESTMTTPCMIMRPTGTHPDPATGADITDEELIYDGSSGAPGCKVQSREPQVQTAESGSATVVVQLNQVHVPVGTGPYRVGDVVQIIADSEVVRRLRVTGLHEKTLQTAQRLPVEELPS